MEDNKWVPPVSFYFKVEFQVMGNVQIKDASFMEITGLKLTRKTSELRRGGENENTVIIPESLSSNKIKMKRALEPLNDELSQWIVKCLSLNEKIESKDIAISLIGANGEVVAHWFCSNAYPVSWEVSSFDSMKNELAIETIEMAYSYLERKNGNSN